MKETQAISAPESECWYRCIRVDFLEKTATWELDQSRRYTFHEAYTERPHRQLILAGDDNALRAFVETWGPLRPFLNDWTGSDPIEAYRRERNRLTTIARLLASVEQPDTQRSALLAFARLSKTDTTAAMLISGLQSQLPSLADAQSGLDALTRKQVEFAITRMVSELPLVGTLPRLTVERTPNGNALRVSMGINSLVDALNWMLWQDVVQNHPTQFCEECRSLIQLKTLHERKFCSPRCAHRKTARTWQQRKRKMDRSSVVA